MKKIFIAILATVFFLASCQQKPAVVPVDTEAVKVQVKEVLDKYESALSAKDLSQISSLYSEDLLYLGTDPIEFWDKEAMVGLWEQAFADTSFTMNFTLDKRDIKLAGDANSAIAVEQFFAPQFSTKIPLRFVYHLVNSEGGWKIDFISAALIPKNEDIAALNKAL